jgi:hypothetical protein
MQKMDFLNFAYTFKNRKKGTQAKISFQTCVLYNSLIVQTNVCRQIGLLLSFVYIFVQVARQYC